jgi:hypothetical protein
MRWLARARPDGYQPRERRPPCFFDPRDGPSVRSVPWAPPGGAPRPSLPVLLTRSESKLARIPTPG